MEAFSLMAILHGLILTVISICVHALGTERWIRYLTNRAHLLQPDSLKKRGVQLSLLCSTAGVLILLHLFEVIIWAIVYVWLVPSHTVDTFEQSLYFSAVTYSSLGYGDMVIPEEGWRLLSGIQAMVGLIVFGWSTALLFVLVQRIWLHDE